ncbi:MAG: glycosyltransferase [Bdellovibrionota bacterium]
MKKLVLVTAHSSSLADIHLPLLALLRASGYEIKVVAGDASGAKRLEAMGIPVKVVGLKTGRSPGKSLWLFLQLWWTFLRAKPVLVHWYTVDGFVIGRLASRAAGVPRLLLSLFDLETRLSGTSLPTRWRAAKLKSGLRHWVSDQRAYFLLENALDQQALEALCAGASARTALVRGPTVDLRRYQPPKNDRVMVDGQTTRILFGQRLRRDSGLLDLRQACLILRARKLDFELVVTGVPEEGNPEYFTNEELRAWRKEGWFKLVGRVDSMDSLLRTSEIAVLPAPARVPSRFLLEAAACGRAIVAADFPATRELIEPEKNGLLFRHGDASSLARALERLIRDSDLRMQLGASARLVAENLFSDEPARASLKNVYDSLVSQA